MKSNILFLETTDGFPVKFTANNSKVKLLASGLKYAGNNVCIINKLQGSDFVKNSFIKGTDETIEYYTFKRHKKSLIGILKNLFFQYKILKKKKIKGYNNIIIMGQPYFPLFIIETCIYKLLGYKVCLTKTEWPSKIKSVKGLKKIDYWLSDNLFGYFVHHIFPISHYIENLCKKFNKPIFMIPILANFPVKIKEKNINEHYFLICSTLAYKENVKLVIDAFCLFMKKNNNECYSLKLVLSGNNKDMGAIYEYIKNSKFSKYIHIFSQIPYDELMELYQNADGLLIPLQDTFQDKARFSQKIAEYLTTGNPIVTNGVGDILYYFKDNVNAFIANSYSVDSYASVMEKIALNHEHSRIVGHNGYVTGKKNFDNIIFCQKLSQYIENL